MMTKLEKERIKKEILKRYKLYKIHSHRLQRLIKDPLRTFPFYILVLLSRIRPFKIKFKTIWGDEMHCYLPDGNAIFYYSCPGEANLTNFFINFLKEGDTFIDIGAHLGFYSLLVARLVGEQGKVYSFEPTPRTFEFLKENVSVTSNIVINQAAVLNKEGLISFVDYGPKYGAFNTFKKRTSEDLGFLKKKQKFIEVKAVVLDKYCRENNIQPTFIKIDAEGAEYLILQGISYILNSLRPFISLEVAGGNEWRENCQRSIKILLDNDYQAFEITVEGKLIAHNIKEEYGYDNLIFIPEERIGSSPESFS